VILGRPRCLGYEYTIPRGRCEVVHVTSHTAPVISKFTLNTCLPYSGFQLPTLLQFPPVQNDVNSFLMPLRENEQNDIGNISRRTYTGEVVVSAFYKV
jgi:hypothetical protein